MSLELVCPKREELRDYALGQLAAPDAGRVRGHVEQCGQCRKALDAISPATMNDAGEEVDRRDPSPTMSGSDRVTGVGRYPFLQPPQAADELGRLGNYRVFEVLGEGGMGIVFRAEDFGLKRPVALKVMRPEMKRDADSGHRFIREARTMAKIKHDHLVTVYSVAEEGDVIYFAMELLDGCSLESWMRDLPPPDAGEIVRLGREIASGLGFIHRKKLIHRDIKPGNIWLEAPTRRVKILDLGLARKADEDVSLTRTGIVLGTPEYMSPEQARGQEVDGRTDLFSLGCILYRLCTGRKPFNGSTYSAVLMSLAADTPLPPCLYNPDIPEGLSDLVMKLLARNPSDRPASAEAVVQALDEVEFVRTQPADHTVPMRIGKKPTTTPPREQTRVAPIAKPRRRWPLVAALVGGTCVVALGLAAAALFVLLPMLQRPPALGVAAGPEKTFLTDMKPIARQNWPFQPPDRKEEKEWKEPKEGKKKGPKGGPPGQEIDLSVRVNGEPKPRGIFAHPPIPPFDEEPCSLTYRLDKNYRTFETDVSLNDGQETESPVTFTVFGDGKRLWRSKPISSSREMEHCSIPVRGVAELKIETTCDGPPRGAHAIWIDPAVIR